MTGSGRMLGSQKRAGCFTSHRRKHVFHMKCWKLWLKCPPFEAWGCTWRGLQSVWHYWDLLRDFPSFSKLFGALQFSLSWQHESDMASVSVAFCHSCLVPVCEGGGGKFCCRIFQGVGMCHTHLLEQQNLWEFWIVLLFKWPVTT